MAKKRKKKMIVVPLDRMKELWKLGSKTIPNKKRYKRNKKILDKFEDLQ